VLRRRERVGGVQGLTSVTSGDDEVGSRVQFKRSAVDELYRATVGRYK
jgi:hypothetical protein